MNTDEQRAYSRGYQAGRKFAERVYDKALQDERREAFRQQAAIAALTAIAAPGSDWGSKSNGEHKPYRTMEECATAAFMFADAMCRHTFFPAYRPSKPEADA